MTRPATAAPCSLAALAMSARALEVDFPWLRGTSLVTRALQAISREDPLNQGDEGGLEKRGKTPKTLQAQLYDPADSLLNCSTAAYQCSLSRPWGHPSCCHCM